ncbi:hypothetical protein CTAYLR_007603 [Chrysophaeum taylorii]|uniref:Uncharacterized protein n=1 Tax=Chrysophaeum taylorii TaxID=2483200 RepID=A0AAD7U6L2_9STRA|nr:hypothetical protein CTAYLR_007603 [Chrysophaeum taylorii]
MARASRWVMVAVGVAAMAPQPLTPRVVSAANKNNESAEALTLEQHAVAGAVARCVAQSAVHPLNVAKTTLQTHEGGEALRRSFKVQGTVPTLSRGVGAQALLSIPNGAINFMAMESARRATDATLDGLGLLEATPRPAVDLVSAGFGTALGTLVSLPQSILIDQIMSGAKRNLADALRTIGWKGLYPASTWRAALLSKVPSYALNWACYQQLRRWRDSLPDATAASPLEDLLIGAIASSVSTCVMIPFDTVKVRMTTKNFGRRPYSGVRDAIVTMLKEEGLMAFYRGLPPRLLSVVPMTAIQFAVYEGAKRHLPDIQRHGRALYSDFALQLQTCADRIPCAFAVPSLRLPPEQRPALCWWWWSWRQRPSLLETTPQVR